MKCYKILESGHRRAVAQYLLVDSMDVGSISTRILGMDYTFSSYLVTRQNSVKFRHSSRNESRGEQSILTLGSLCLSWYIRESEVEKK